MTRFFVFASCAGLMTNCPAAFSDVFTPDHEVFENGSQSKTNKVLMINNTLCWLRGVIKSKAFCIKFVTQKNESLRWAELRCELWKHPSSTYKRIATYSMTDTYRSQIWCVTTLFHPVALGWFETSLYFHFRKTQAVKLN